MDLGAQLGRVDQRYESPMRCAEAEYSRGPLYYAMQPFWHTGLRANIAVTEGFALNALIVNGVNNAFENNKSPSLGLQAVITASDVFSLAAGYLGALNPTQGGNGPFQNLFDVVATVTAGGFKLVANADLRQLLLLRQGQRADEELLDVDARRCSVDFVIQH